MSPTSLQSVPPSISLTKSKVKQLEAISLIREERGNGRQRLAYNARPCVLCGIPLRRPPKDQLTYTRRNGKFFLDIAGHPRFGLPFGQDRLIPIWVATLAVQQKSRLVHSPAQLSCWTFSDCPKTAVITAESCRISSATLRPRFSSGPMTSRIRAD